jgi:hypothetical protein
MSRTGQTARTLIAAVADQDRAAIIGRASSHVAWALAAAEAGDLVDTRVFLNRAAAALGVKGPSPLYIALAPSFARQHSEEAY